MRKIAGLFFFSLSVISLYAMSDQEKAVEKVRSEIRKEEKAKQKAIEEEQRKVNESLIKKTFEIDEGMDKDAETVDAFNLGKDRLSLIASEEKNIIEMEKELGVKPNKQARLLSRQYDQVYNQYMKNHDKKVMLKAENEKLKEYLERVRAMKKSLQQ